jgi:hypothetical protein
MTSRPSKATAEVPSARNLPTTVAAGGRLRAAVTLSVIVLVAMAAASAAGLLVDGLYQDPESTASMLRGYDVVTLLVAVPLLATALWFLRRGSVRAQMVWLGVLAYGVYNYALYLFGSAFNDLFLLHVIAFSASLSALVLALSTLDMAGVVRRISPRTPARWISGLLAFLALGLGGMWIVNAVRFAVTGIAPPGSALVETPTVTHLGYALDLSLLVPAYTLAAVLLWHRAAWGHVAAATVLVSGTIHQLGYLVALPLQVRAGVPGATAIDPGEPPIALAFLLATAALLAGVRRPRRPKKGR